MLPKPSIPRLVVDYANVLAQHDADELERKLVELDKSTSNQISVVTVATLNGEAIEDVANETYRAWGIGDKKNNNGVLLLIAINDRKVRIEVGYGLEGAIPDVTANSIIRKDITPAFKQSNYLGGITAAVDDLAKAATGEYKIPKQSGSGLSSKSIGAIIKIIIFIFIIIVLSLKNKGGGGNYRGRNSDILWPLLFSGGGGGGFGGFGGGSSGGGGASGSW